MERYYTLWKLATMQTTLYDKLRVTVWGVGDVAVFGQQQCRN